MAQGSKKKNAPVYAMDTLFWMIFGGLMLIGLGVIIFMAVDLNMAGNIFGAVRSVVRGITGFMGFVVPVLPVWAGVLLVISHQRRANWKPLIWASVAFCCVCAFVILSFPTGDRNNQTTALNWLAGQYGTGWGQALAGGYEKMRSHGGALGVLLAWPLWALTRSDILCAAVYLFLGIFSALMVFNLSPRRIVAIATGRETLRRKRGDEDEETRRQIEWQRQQEEEANRRAWEQQQAMILQQQQQQQQQPSQPQTQPVSNAGQRAVTYSQQMQFPVGEPIDDGGIGEWRSAPVGQTTGGSRIFDQPAPAAAPAPAKKPRKSVIFRHEDREDGLTDPDAERYRRPRNAGQETGETPAAPRKNTRKQPEPVWNSQREAFQTPSGSRSDTETTGGTAERTSARENADGRPERENNGNRTGFETGRSPFVQENTATRERPVQPARPVIPEPEPEEEPAREPERPERTRPAPRPAFVPKAEPIGEKAYKPELNRVETEDREESEEYWRPTPYYAPPITDLAAPDPGMSATREEIEMRSRRLEEVLASFNVPAQVRNVTQGPAISRFELELASGTKVAKITGLEKDIALGMEATSVRIEAPIPGKSLVGVEVPNRQISKVRLREVLQSDAMQNAKSILTVALGKDIAGAPVVCDLARMPHLLIAGATGSGKSVCINAIINSLLYRASPDEVKMIMVDPKVVELQCYNGIPHLLIPVVNDPHKAAAALAWAVAEMMERYDKFAERKVRNLEGYNHSLGEGEKPMPRILIIIDELADLMMVCKKDVEEYICRLTQLARAAGMHLIVATQRPSVDVITGLIKANIPSRIAFKTASYIDSRTILDRNGSEMLLGWGDMLYLPTGSFSPQRIQGCFLDDDEVNRITAHVKEANPSVIDQNILDRLDELARDNGNAGGGSMDVISGPPETLEADASLLNQAMEIAVADGQISTSTIQRRLKVGYARAGRLTDEMEERGFISAKDGSKPRKCLLTREEWENMKKLTEE